MEDLKEILSNQEVLKLLSPELLQKIILDSINSNNKFRNTQRVFGFSLGFPFLVVGFCEMFYKTNANQYFWFGTLAMLIIGLSFFFPKQSTPLVDALKNKISQ